MRLGRENFRVPGERNACRPHRLLVERRRCHCGDLAAERSIDGILDVRVAGASGGGVDSAGFKIARANRADVEHARSVSLAQAANDFPRLGQAALIGRLFQHGGIPKNNRRAKPRDLPVLQQVQTNFRPHPGGVAHRHGNFWEAHLLFDAWDELHGVDGDVAGAGATVDNQIIHMRRIHRRQHR